MWRIVGEEWGVGWKRLMICTYPSGVVKVVKDDVE